MLCGLVVLLDGFDLQTMALAVPSLAQEWQAESAAFSFALSAALIGMLLGSAVVAPLGDRVGRRPVLIAGMIAVGAGSLLTGFAADPTDLSIWRFVTGLGLGMSLPNATALTSEYVPLRSRVLLISLMYCCVALGALIAGFVAPALIDAFGWRSIFFAGGVLPLAVAVILAVAIPESLRLLVARRPGDPRIPLIAARFLPGVDPATLVARAAERVDEPNVLALLTPTYRARTILLWLTFALNLFILFVLVSWLPTVLSDAGWTRAQALRGSVMNQAGGIVGGLLIAWLIDRGRIMPAMIGGYLLVAIALSLFLVVPSTVPSWVTLLLLVGAGVSGGQVALNAMSVLFYPPPLRATGSRLGEHARQSRRAARAVCGWVRAAASRPRARAAARADRRTGVAVRALRGAVVSRRALTPTGRRKSLDRLIDERLPRIRERKIDRHVLRKQQRHHLFLRIHDDPGRRRARPTELTDRPEVAGQSADRRARSRRARNRFRHCAR